MTAKIINKKVSLKNYRPSPDCIIIISLILLVVASKANVLNLPYYWDEMGAYLRPTHWLTQTNLLNVLPGFHPPDLFFGHPPAFYFTLSAAHCLFGESILVSHLYALLFAFLGIYFTYLLGQLLFDRTTGIMASVLLFFTPLYFAQSGMMTADIAITALSVMTVYFMLKERIIAYLLSALFMVMMKETAAAIIAVILIYQFWIQRKQNGLLLKLAIYSIPLVALAIFFIWQKMATGIFLPNPYFNSNAFISLDPVTILHKLIHGVGRWIFWEQKRNIVTFIILFAVIINLKQMLKKELALFLLIFFIYLFCFSFIFFLPRYALITLPFFFIIGAKAISTLTKDLKKKVGITIVLLILSITQFHNAPPEIGYDVDMQYVDVITTHKKACEYIEKHFQKNTIWARWPLSDQLEFPFLGYVTKPIRTVYQGVNYDVIVYTPEGVPQNSELKGIIENLKLSPIQSFEKNGKYVQIFHIKQ